MLKCPTVPLCRIVLIALLLSIGRVKTAYAQIIPDETLGTETSTIGVDQVNNDAAQIIEGGAIRGGNLFHSFSEFNIDAGEAVYFVTPADINNILSRVTGDSLSTIDGVLGVRGGDANLFFVNPNGIIFGPEAQLHLSGSFTASTAESFRFADGGEFSAVAPETSLLSVSVPLGLQLNTQAQGDLVNAAFLAVGQGENLHLMGDQVSTSVQLSAPGGVAEVWGNQIELLDRQALPISNPTDDTEVIFRAADGITIPDVIDNELRFLDGVGDIQLIADADTDDAGNLVMVDVQDSLRANGRNLEVSGVDISLGGIDTSFSGDMRDGGAIAISSVSGDITTQDLFTFSYSSSGNSGNGGSIDISSTDGDITTQFSNSRSVSVYGNSGNGGSIDISSTNGDITTQDLSSRSGSVYGNGGTGGAITISSINGDIETQGGLYSSSYSSSFSYLPSGNSGNGGSIDISSTYGNITTQRITSSSYSSPSFPSSSGDSGNGGAITIASNYGDITTQEVRSSSSSSSSSSSGDSGDGGAINISSISGDITTQGVNSSSDSFSIKDSGDSGNGGAITIFSTYGDVTAPYVSSGSGSYLSAGNASNGGVINISSTSGDVTIPYISSGSRSRSGDTGNGGAIIISSTDGDISTQSVISISFAFPRSSSPYGDSGNGGAISISSTSGDITTQGINSRSGSVSGNSGNGGTITISSTDGNITNQGFVLSSSSSSGNSGNGGAISISSTDGDITNEQRVESDSSGGESGNGGIITISSISGDIINEQRVNSGSFSSSGSSSRNNGNGGAITISSISGDITTQDLNSFSYSYGNSGSGGNILIVAEEGRIAGNQSPLLFSGSFSSTGETTDSSGTATLYADDISDLTIVTVASGGRSGDVDIHSLGNSLTVNNVSIITTAQIEIPDPINPEATIPLDLRNIGQSGNTSLSSARGIVLNNVSIQGDANGNQAAGNTTITSPSQITFNNSQISSNAASSGAAGNILIEADRLSLGENDRISASTTGSGNAGDIDLNISDQLTIDGSTVESRTEPNSRGQGGNISVSSVGQVSLLNGGNFTLNSEGAGEGGDFIISADTLTLDRSQITATTQDSNGGDFTFNLGDYLLLRNSSLISTTAGLAGARGNGGSIAINMPNGFIIAVPEENSDIRANAFEGDGGTVNITVRNLLGIAFRPGLSDTPFSDITSSSQLGNSGVVTIDELNTETLQPEIELPVETTPATVARGCRAQGSQTGSFVNTGRGGIPTSPAAPLSDNTVWQDLAPLPNLSDLSGSDNNNTVAQLITRNAPEPILEAQHWSRDEDGTVTLLAHGMDSFQLSQSIDCEGRDRTPHSSR